MCDVHHISFCAFLVRIFAFFSYAFLYGNFCLLGYLYGVIPYILLTEHLVRSKVRIESVFVCADETYKTLLVSVRKQKTFEHQPTFYNTLFRPKQMKISVQKYRNEKSSKTYTVRLHFKIAAFRFSTKGLFSFRF